MPSKLRAPNWMVVIKGTHTLPKIDTSKVTYYIFGRETNQRTHDVYLQGYIEFNTRIPKSTALHALNCEAIITPREGTQAHAIEFCKKQDKEPYEWGHHKRSSNVPKHKKVPRIYYTKSDLQLQNDLDSAYRLVKDGMSAETIRNKHNRLWYKYKDIINEWLDDIDK